MATNTTEADVRKATDIISRLLKFRPRSEGEIRKKLTEKNIPLSVVEPTVERFKNLRLIDDRQFAQGWVASRLKKPLGINRVRQELREKHVEKTLIEESLKTAYGSHDEEAVVTELAKRRAEKYKNIAPPKLKRRIYAYLQRRGFTTDTINQVIQKL
jgi:regulatory protein